MRSGTAAIVRRFAVTSSPRAPSPRVAPRVKTPFSYTSETAEPSTFGSSTYATGSSVSSRLRTSSAHFESASAVVTFSSEPIGERCATLRKPSAGGAPTRCVGESGVRSSGCSSSSATSSS